MLDLFTNRALASYNKSLLVRLEAPERISADHDLSRLCAFLQLCAHGVGNRIAHIGVAACCQPSLTVRAVCREIILKKNGKLRCRTEEILVSIRDTQELCSVIIGHRLCSVVCRLHPMCSNRHRSHNKQ